MSIFNPVDLKCPHCGEPVAFKASASVNADRRPDLRTAILDGSFQRQQCPHCGESFRVEPQLNYLDVGRGQWIAALPADWVDRWAECEATSAEAFSQAFGDQASADAREIGAGLQPRLVFGWRALAEKLIACEAGLDDGVLEVAKMALMQGLEDEPLEVGQQLRLTAIDAENATLDLLIVARDGSEGVAEELSVPRGLYDEVLAEPDDWQALRDKVSAGLFVDVARLTRGVQDPA
jgi:endogenous inhibitor of DNA gyrase (YacG/DUF329 family)